MASWKCNLFLKACVLKTLFYSWAGDWFRGLKNFHSIFKFKKSLSIRNLETSKVSSTQAFWNKFRWLKMHLCYVFFRVLTFLLNHQGNEKVVNIYHWLVHTRWEAININQNTIRKNEGNYSSLRNMINCWCDGIFD